MDCSSSKLKTFALWKIVKRIKRQAPDCDKCSQIIHPTNGWYKDVIKISKLNSKGGKRFYQKTDKTLEKIFYQGVYMDGK